MAEGKKEFAWTIRSTAEGDGIRKTAAELTELEKATETAAAGTEKLKEETKKAGKEITFLGEEQGKVKTVWEDTHAAVEKATEATVEHTEAVKKAKDEGEEQGEVQEAGIDRFIRLGGAISASILIFREVAQVLAQVIEKVMELTNAWAQGQGFTDAADFMAHAFGTASTEIDGATLALIRSAGQARALANESQVVADVMAALKTEAAQTADNIERGSRAMEAQMAARDMLAQKALQLELAEIEAGGGSPVEKEKAKAAAMRESAAAGAAAREEARAAQEAIEKQRIEAAKAAAAAASEAAQREQVRLAASLALQEAERERNALMERRNEIDKIAPDRDTALSRQIRGNFQPELDSIAEGIEKNNRTVAGARAAFPNLSRDINPDSAEKLLKPLMDEAKAAAEALAEVTREAGSMLATIGIARDTDRAGSALDAKILDTTSAGAIAAAHMKEAAERAKAEEAFNKEEKRELARINREIAKQEAAEKKAGRGGSKTDALDGVMADVSSAAGDLAQGLSDRNARAQAAAVKSVMERLLEERDEAMVAQFVAALGTLSNDISGNRVAAQVKKLEQELEKLSKQIANQRSAGGN